MNQLAVQPSGPLQGSIGVPGDKSISHRTLLLGALADGASHIRGFLPSADCLATLGCIRALGVAVTPLSSPPPHQGGGGTSLPGVSLSQQEGDYATLVIHGRGLRGLQAPQAPLDCARSGTTMRLLAGIMAGQSFDSVLTGDPQLRGRPMERIARPLRQMGAQIETVDGHAPLTIRGRRLQGYDHRLPVASAQVKSAILLAGLHADGPTVVRQPGPARDHTELMLEAMGSAIEITGLTVTLAPRPSPLAPLNLTVPGDMSSAAFPLVAAALVPGSQVTVDGVGLNPTRTGLLDVLGAMGADITVENEREQGGEPVADITVRASELRSTEISGHTVVRMIDEFPVLAVAATQADGTTAVHDAAELRVKETDRIAVIAGELQKLGARIQPQPDGFVVEGPTPLHGAVVDSHSDHRIAMALAIAGLVAQGETTISNTTCIADSFPGFVEVMRNMGAAMAIVEAKDT